MLRNSSIVALLLAFATAAPSQEPSPPKPTPEEARARERNVLLTVQTVLLAQRTYARERNGGLFDELHCLSEPEKCIPNFPEEGAPYLDPTYDWEGVKLTYERKFHPGPKATPDEIRKAKAASPTSLKAFAYTATPVSPELGLHAYCGDSSGQMCTSEGPPSVKNGRCDPCQKLQ